MKTILIDGSGGVGWIGGLYYKRNVCYALLHNSKMKRHYRVMVFTTPEYVELFRQTGIADEAVVIAGSSRWIDLWKLCQVVRKYHVDYIYPQDGGSLQGKVTGCFGARSIGWIPDFQDNWLKALFSTKELTHRKKVNSRQLADGRLLILSSHDSERDAHQFYQVHAKVRVMPFVSAIESELSALTPVREYAVLEKFGLLSKGYVCVANQFWQHKNHIVVLQALQCLAEQGRLDGIKVVMTGQLQDYRNPAYYQSLLAMLADAKIKEHVQVLGFLERIDQLAVMKQASYILQPSLFEGWGTVVEDAKVMDKLMLLSDISVHLEQMDEHGMTFEARNSHDLADKMLLMQERSRDYQENIERGLSSMRERAVIYADAFVDLLT